MSFSCSLSSLSLDFLISLTRALISFSCGSSINRCSACGSLSAVFEPEKACFIPSSLAGTSSRLVTAMVEPDLGSGKSCKGGVLPPIDVSCSPLYLRPYCFANFWSFFRSKAKIFISKPLAILITCFPILPTPTTPRVFPFKSNHLRLLSKEKFPKRVLSQEGQIFLDKAKIRAKVCSATVFSP